MEKSFEKYKGIHPGKVLSRILEPTDIKKAELARKIGTYPQTLNEILKGKRNLPIQLSLRIDKQFGYKEGTFAELQTYFDIKKAKMKMEEYHPDLNKIRTEVFWDTNIENIDFEKQKKGVIERVLERGNELEKEEIYHFYGDKTIKTYFDKYIDLLDDDKKSKYFSTLLFGKMDKSICINKSYFEHENDNRVESYKTIIDSIIKITKHHDLMDQKMKFCEKPLSLVDLYTQFEGKKLISSMDNKDYKSLLKSLSYDVFKTLFIHWGGSLLENTNSKVKSDIL
ncbi:HigA family addiction module antitoxin [Sphingobacterium sp.]|uniref:HigA family addiction module antitoxin n=1 Tax=Sphingobacterium sp. TaxID=341027 RepID=UPI0028A0524E|nr:HigA family addiction module antitoxin [Sphingobacterium sp.]